MIRLDSISKQNGHQILFIEASAVLNRGEKIGLVGPNGAGKTTLFRMIKGEDQPDEGQVSIDRGLFQPGRRRHGRTQCGRRSDGRGGAGCRRRGRTQGA
jgi:ATPase subunit of ABC transporter with duplicated ATPase domains